MDMYRPCNHSDSLPGRNDGRRQDDLPSVEAETSTVCPPTHWHAVMAAMTGGLLFLAGGTVFGWSSPAETFYKGTVSDTTWTVLAGMSPLGGVLGPIPMGFLTDRFGRKPCLLGISLLYVISWAVVGLTTDIPVLFAARFLLGVGMGATTAVLPLYINDIATDKLRPTFGAMMHFQISAGLLLTYVVGPFCGLLAMNAVCGAIPLVFFIIFLAMPESPFVLVDRGDLEGAFKSVAWLRGQKLSEVSKEVTSIQIFTDRVRAQRGPFFKKVAVMFSDTASRRAFLISLSLSSFVQGTGMGPVTSFAQSIFESTGSHLKPEICTIILGAVKTITSVGCIVFTRCFSMKALLVVSAMGMTVGHSILTLYFFLKSWGVDVSQAGFVPLLGLLVFVFLYSLGFGSLPFAVAAELLSSGDSKAIAMALCSTYVWITAFVLTAAFGKLLEIFGSGNVFLGFTAASFGAAIYTLLWVPNTRHQSLEEIRVNLETRKPVLKKILDCVRKR